MLKAKQNMKKGQKKLIRKPCSTICREALFIDAHVERRVVKLLGDKSSRWKPCCRCFVREKGEQSFGRSVTLGFGLGVIVLWAGEFRYSKP